MKPEQYKAAIYRGIGSVDVVEKDYPVCGDDEVIVKNLIAGICGSDIGAFKSGGDAHMIWKDFEFGHEVISEVVEVGKDVTGVSVGEWIFPNQGAALRDRSRMATVGGFSEYIKIPQYEENYSAIKIDNSIPLKMAILFEPFVIGTRAAQNLKPGPGKTAVVFGAGIIGMSAAIMMKWYGCDKVMIVDVSDYRLANAARYGLVTCNAETEDLRAKAIEEFGAGVGFGGEYCAANLFLDAFGAGAAIEYFTTIGGREATLGVVGVHHEPVSLDFMRVTYNNWHINGGGSITIFEAAVDILKMMKSGEYDLTPLVSHEYPIEQISEALTMAANPKEAQKVCITYA